MSDGARLEAQGKLDEALKAFTGHRDWDGAVRVAMALNRHADAGKYCLEAQRWWDAAVCFQRAGQLKDCLGALLKVPATNPRYRQACVQVVRVAGQLNVSLETLSMWFMPFIAYAPAAPVEAEAMKDIADAFAAAGKTRLALSIVRTVLSAYPADDDAKERLQAIERKETDLALSSTPGLTSVPVTSSRSGVHVAVKSSSSGITADQKPPSGAYPAASSPSGLQQLPVTSSGSGLRSLTGSPPPIASSPSGTLAAPSAFGSPSGVRSGASAIRAPKRRLGSLLVEKGMLSLSLLERLTREQPELTRNELSLAEAVVSAGLVKDEEVLRVLSEQHNLPFILAPELLGALMPEVTKVVSEDQARGWRVVPFKLVDRQLHVAMEDPRDVALVDRLRFATRLKIVAYFTTPAALRRATSKLYQGYDPEENAPAWHGQNLFDPAGDASMIEPYSDRVTGTREKMFDTGEFARREAGVLDLIGPPPLASAPPPPIPLKATAPSVTPTGMPLVGSMLGDRYRLDTLLGEGGSASVFKAMDLELNEPVAIKVFHPANEREADTLVARFKLELSLSRALSHPNITRLFDLGSFGPWRYLSMELLEGADLHQKLTEARGPLPFREGFAWLEQVCLGLQAAHERDVVHRDIKPQNLFVTTSGQVKLMDFGIARKRTAVGVTMNGMIGGTPEYMSPEQINSFSDVTYATDLYALGITTYQLFTAKLPFDYPELTRILIAQSTEAPVPPRQHNPHISELLERLILQLLEKDPKKRPESAAWVAQQFRALRTVTR